MIFVQVCLPLSIGVSRLCSHLFVPVVAFDDWNGSGSGGSPDGVASAVVSFQSPAPGYLPKHLSILGLVDYALSFALEVDRETLLLCHLLQVLKEYTQRE